MADVLYGALVNNLAEDDEQAHRRIDLTMQALHGVFTGPSPRAEATEVTDEKDNPDAVMSNLDDESVGRIFSWVIKHKQELLEQGDPREIQFLAEAEVARRIRDSLPQDPFPQTKNIPPQ